MPPKTRFPKGHVGSGARRPTGQGNPNGGPGNRPGQQAQGDRNKTNRPTDGGKRDQIVVNAIYDFLRDQGSSVIDCSNMKERAFFTGLPIRPDFGVPHFRGLMKEALGRLAFVNGIDLSRNAIREVRHVQELLDLPNVRLTRLKLDNNHLSNPKDFDSFRSQVFQRLIALQIDSNPVLSADDLRDQALSAVLVHVKRLTTLIAVNTGAIITGDELIALRARLVPANPALAPGAPHVPPGPTGQQVFANGLDFFRRYCEAIDTQNWDALLDAYHSQAFVSVTISGPVSNRYVENIRTHAHSTTSADVGIHYGRAAVTQHVQNVLYGGELVAATRHRMATRADVSILSQTDSQVSFVLRTHGAFKYVLHKDAENAAKDLLAAADGAPRGRHNAPRPTAENIRAMALKMLEDDSTLVRTQGIDRTMVLLADGASITIVNDIAGLRAGDHTFLVPDEPLRPLMETPDAQNVGPTPLMANLLPGMYDRFRERFRLDTVAFVCTLAGQQQLPVERIEEMLKTAAQVAWPAGPPQGREMRDAEMNVRLVFALKILKMVLEADPTATLAKISQTLPRLEEWAKKRALGLGMQSGLEGGRRANWEAFACIYNGSLEELNTLNVASKYQLVSEAIAKQVLVMVGGYVDLVDDAIAKLRASQPSSFRSAAGGPASPTGEMRGF